MVRATSARARRAGGRTGSKLLLLPRVWGGSHASLTHGTTIRDTIMAKRTRRRQPKLQETIGVESVAQMPQAANAVEDARPILPKFPVLIETRTIFSDGSTSEEKQSMPMDRWTAREFYRQK